MSNIISDIKLSGVTYQIEDSTALHTLDDNVTSGGTNAVKGSGIYSAITAATAALAETVAQELSAKTDNDTFTAYTAATDTVLGGKADTTAVTQAISEATSGKVDNDTYTAYTAATEAVLSGKADASDLTSLFGNVDYDSNTKRINFYHESTTGTVLAYVDASDFIKDGMVDNVEIKDVTPTATSIPTNNVKLYWADGYTAITGINESYHDGTHSTFDITKVEFGNMSNQSFSDSDYAFRGDNCYQLTSATFVGDVYITDCFDSAFKLQEVYFYADSPSGFTHDEYLGTFLGTVYDGCETYETTAATYPIYVANLANYQNATLAIGGMNTTWGERFGNRLKQIESTKVLAITFNTDAGKEEIDIPISDIFDASNYYTKDEVDQAISGFAESTAVTQEISEAVSGKADTTAVTQAISEAVSGKADSSDVEALSGTVTAHTADTTIHVTSSDKTTWSGKQDALVSGTNIKTINGNSILGSGNSDVQTLPTVSGTTLVFS